MGAFQDDGRQRENRNGIGTRYSYDAANRVIGSSAGESWSYDANGNLAMLDRGQKQSGPSSMSHFEYDLEGQIVSETTKPTALSGARGRHAAVHRDVRYLETASSWRCAVARGTIAALPART